MAKAKNLDYASAQTPLLVLPQSKMVENTTKFIENKLSTEKNVVKTGYVHRI